MTAENIVFVLNTIVVAIIFGILFKLYIYGIRGFWLVFALFIPFVVFYISTVVALEHKNDVKSKLLFHIELYILSIKHFPALVGITAKWLYLLMNKRIKLPKKLLSYKSIPPAFQQFFDMLAV